MGRWSIKEDPVGNLDQPTKNRYSVSRRVFWLTSILLIAFFAVLPALSADVFANLGNLARLHAVVTTASSQSDRQSGELLKTARTRYEQALDIQEDHRSALWGLLRTELALSNSGMTGNKGVELLTHSLQPLVADSAHNVLLYQDVLVALSRSGQVEEAIALHKSRPVVEQSRIISDTIASAYLQRDTRETYISRALCAQVISTPISISGKWLRK